MASLSHHALVLLKSWTPLTGLILGKGSKLPPPPVLLLCYHFVIFEFYSGLWLFLTPSCLFLPLVAL